MAKQLSSRSAPASAVRTRRAYFDCKFGQLHVRTAFPTTGGFDEGVTFFCLHPEDGSSRTFEQFLPEIADVRSVYAPDLPGCGESDAAPELNHAAAAGAVSDLAADLRLRQIDLLGFRFGAGVALRLCATRPDLVRRLVLIGAPPMDDLPVLTQRSLVLRVKLGVSDDSQWVAGVLPNVQFVDLAGYASDVFAAAPTALAKTVGEFLAAKP